MDETGFEELYAATWRQILGYALRRTADREDAADIVAEVFTVAWRRRADIPPEPEARLWLFGVARYALANQHRGELRRTKLAGALRVALADVPDDPVDVMLSRQETASVLAGLGELPDIERELVTLVAWDGLTPSGAAAVVGISAAAARVRLHRARKRLKRLSEEPAQRAGRSGHVIVDGHLPVPVKESS